MNIGLKNEDNDPVKGSRFSKTVFMIAYPFTLFLILVLFQGFFASQP